MFNPAQYQPLSVYFDLKLGGLHKIYESPNIPIEMEFRQSIKQAPTVTFTLFDEAGWEVEPYIWESRDPNTRVPGGTFQFGYKGSANEDSEEYTFQFQNVKPKYQDNAFYLTIYGFVTGISLQTTSKQYNGTIEEIFQKIADEHEYDLIIEPKLGKEYMQEQGALDEDSTAKVEMKHSKYMWEPDWRYIQRLCTYARDQEGKVGYHPVLTCKDGKKTLLITKAKSSSADYEYIVQDKDSVVVEWSPDVTFAAIFDESDTHHNGHQPGTGYTSKQAFAQEVTKDYIEDFGNDVFQTTKAVGDQQPPDQINYICAEDMPENVTKGAIRSRSAHTRSPWAGSNPALHTHGKHWMGLNYATLEVCGDPNITINSQSNAIPTVDVKFYTPINYFNTSVREEHYTSGIWQVTDIIQRVGIGKFTTTYNLERAGHPELPQSQSKQQ